MRIGIDARELAGRPTGVGRYLSHILVEWGTTGEAARHEFVLYLPSPASPTVAPLLTALRAKVTVVPGVPGTWWEQVQFPRAARRAHLDVLFAPAYTAPLLTSCPTVVTVHDLSYMAHPEWFPAREGWRRRVLTRAAARRARVVLTDSAFSRSEVVRLTGVAPERVQVIYLGAGIDSPPVAAGHREPVILFVGSIFNRRRIPDLVRAFARMAAHDPDVSLDIVGEDRTWPAQHVSALIGGLGLGSRARLHSYVEDAALRDLYRRASVFVFLSEYEGFGLTPLEALAHGVPIVVLDTPVAREIYGASAAYVAPGDLDAIVAAVTMLIADGPAREQQLAAAAGTLARYSWPDTAARTLAVLTSAGR
jgi:glycosyltransferase involved in cell wall biosynthesis